MVRLTALTLLSLGFGMAVRTQVSSGRNIMQTQRVWLVDYSGRVLAVFGKVPQVSASPSLGEIVGIALLWNSGRRMRSVSATSPSKR